MSPDWSASLREPSLTISIPLHTTWKPRTSSSGRVSGLITARPRWPRNGEAAQSTSIRSPIGRRVTAPWNSSGVRCVGWTSNARWVAARMSDQASSRRPVSPPATRHRSGSLTVGPDATAVSSAWARTDSSLSRSRSRRRIVAPLSRLVRQFLPGRALARDRDERVEGGRIGERGATRHPLGRLAAEDLLHGGLELLSGQRARDGWDRLDRVGHVARGELRAQRFGDLHAQRGIERRAGRRHDEQEELAGTAAGVLEVNAERVDDLRDVLDDGIELARAEANAAAVERGIGASGEDAAAPLGEHDPVSLAPHARVHVEVRGAVAIAARIVPEGHGHRRHRRGDHELAELADGRLAPVGFERVGVDPQTGTGDLALVNGLGVAP